MEKLLDILKSKLEVLEPQYLNRCKNTNEFHAGQLSGQYWTTKDIIGRIEEEIRTEN